MCYRFLVFYSRQYGIYLIGFQLFIFEKLKQILNIFMLIYVIKIFSFLIVCATIE